MLVFKMPNSNILDKKKTDINIKQLVVWMHLKANEREIWAKLETALRLKFSF